jgi:preprotein translocase subunit SecB
MADQPSQPVFRLQKMYVKDLSFESPNAPQVFFLREEPKVDVKLSLSNRKLDDDHWEAALSITATATAGEQTLFLVEVEHAGAFQISGVPEEHLPRVLAVDCPTLLFPFTRQILSQAAVDGGFLPFLLEPIHFGAMYEAGVKAKEGKH